MSANKITSPGLELYQKVRAAFITRGTSLGEWIRSEGCGSYQPIKDVLIGRYNGPKARQQRARVLEAAGIALEKADD